MSEGWLAGTENWNPPPAVGAADGDDVEKGEGAVPKPPNGLDAERENGEDEVVAPAVEVAGLGTENAKGDDVVAAGVVLAFESVVVVEVVVAVETPKLNPPKAGLGAGFSPMALKGTPKLSLGAASDPEVVAPDVPVDNDPF